MDSISHSLCHHCFTADAKATIIVMTTHLNSTHNEILQVRTRKSVTSVHPSKQEENKSIGPTGIQATNPIGKTEWCSTKIQTKKKNNTGFPYSGPSFRFIFMPNLSICPFDFLSARHQFTSPLCLDKMFFSTNEHTILSHSKTSNLR